MKPSRIAVGVRSFAIFAVAALATILLITSHATVAAQAPGGRGPAGPPPTGPVTLNLVMGSTATYRVQEQLAGVNFPSDAVGTTDAVTGTIALNADGSVNSSDSKLTVDLRTLKSDQDLRDNYVRTRTFQVDQFPNAEFVPRTITGLASPLPITGQSGFQMTGDMTIHGVTKPVTWNGIVTFTKDGVAGRAMTDLTFDEFGLMKPTLARLLSVGDKIGLEVEFRAKRG